MSKQWPWIQRICLLLVVSLYLSGMILYLAFHKERLGKTVALFMLVPMAVILLGEFRGYPRTDDDEEGKGE